MKNVAEEHGLLKNPKMFDQQPFWERNFNQHRNGEILFGNEHGNYKDQRVYRILPTKVLCKTGR